MIVNLLVILSRQNSFMNMKTYLQKTFEIIKTSLKMDNNEINLFLNIIGKNIFEKDKNFGLYLNNIITQLCNKL